MKSKLLFAAAILGVVFASAGAASRSGSKTPVVLREEPDGEWQMFFWPPACSSGNLYLLYRHDATQPVEVVCGQGKEPHK